MKLNDYQRGAKQFAVYPGAKIPESYELTPPAIYPFLGLSEETGEVMGKLAKVSARLTALFIGCELTCTITSPSLSPALSAGYPGATLLT